MKSFRILILTAIALLVSGTPAMSQVFLSFSTGKEYRQSGLFNVSFLGGDLFLNFQDGFVTLFDCADQPSPTVVFPNAACANGTTGFIAAGDLDGDNVRDDLSFWSVATVAAAALVEPFLPERCLLASAPPSKLPRPLGPFVDLSSIVFYNTLTDLVNQFNISGYQFTRNYPAGAAGRAQMNEEIVIGTYVFTFPALGQPSTAVGIQVGISPIPEGFDPMDRHPVNPFRFTSGFYNADGFYLMDHRLTTTVTWTGIDITNYSGASDAVSIQILDGMEATVLFPPSGGSLNIPNPLLGEYFLPPLLSGLENDAVFGQNAVLELRFNRVRATSAIAFDTSVRLFSFVILYVDSYQGYRISTFPTGQQPSATAASGDYDDDGSSNVEEYAMQTDPTNAADFPAELVAIQNPDDTVSFTMDKRPNGAAKYSFEVSFGNGNYRLIRVGDATWNIIEDESSYTITTKQPADAADYQARRKIAQIILR